MKYKINNKNSKKTLIFFCYIVNKSNSNPKMTLMQKVKRRGLTRRLRVRRRIITVCSRG